MGALDLVLIRLDILDVDVLENTIQKEIFECSTSLNRYNFFP